METKGDKITITVADGWESIRALRHRAMNLLYSPNAKGRLLMVVDRIEAAIAEADAKKEKP